ncbi:hypothetical protein PRIPAC_93705, partial [Pristionchus pacificus]
LPYFSMMGRIVDFFSSIVDIFSSIDLSPSFQWNFESVSFVEALFLVQLLYCLLLFIYHNRKTIIQDFYNEKAEFTETREGHICPSSDIIFSLTNEDAEKVWVTGSFVGWSTLIEMRRDPRRPNEWRVRLTLPYGHHQFRFIVDGFWFIRDGIALECDDKGELCHYVHLPIDERRRHFERLHQSKKKAKWNMEKGEFIEAKDIFMYR